MTTVTADRRERVSSVGLIALGLALVGFPVFKVQVMEHLSVIVRYGETGKGQGLLAWSLCYIGGELVIAALCIASLRSERRPLSDVGIIAPTSRKWWIVLWTVLAVAAGIVVLRHVDVLTIMGRPGMDYGVLAARNTWQRIEIVLSSAFVVPIEELIWRGFAITRLQRLGAPVWLAVLVPSLAFGYFHGGTVDTLWISAFITLAVSGLGIIFLRTRSLAWPILIHFGWNALLVSATPQPV